MNDGKLNKLEEEEVRIHLLEEKIAEMIDEQQFSRTEAFTAISNLLVASLFSLVSDMNEGQLRKFMKLYLTDFENRVLEVRRLTKAKGDA